MLSKKEIICPINLLNLAHKKKPVKAAIVNAGKPLPMISVQDAVKENLIEPIFIGNKKEILNCANQIKWDITGYEIIDEPVENKTANIAAKLASEDKIRIIVKGHIHTDILMKEVLKREYNLLGKTRLSHIWHMTTTKDDKPLIITDGALNVLPNIKTKISNLLEALDLETKPELCYPTVPDGKKGNMKIAKGCNWCNYKQDCYKDSNGGQGLRAFKYANGMSYLTEVVVTPKVEEYL